MGKLGPIARFIFFLLPLLAAVCATAAETEEERVDVYALDDEIVAVIDGSRTVGADLRLRERVRWSRSRGRLGAVLTDAHFYVISTESADWRAYPLSLAASDQADAYLSETLALLVMGKRVVVFDALTNQFIPRQVPLRDDIHAAQVAQRVALIATSSRLLGFASGARTFAEARLKLDETIASIRVSDRKATVRTSERLLIFGADTSRWRARPL